MLDQLSRKASTILEGTKVESVEGGLGRVRVNVAVGDDKQVIEGTHLLLAVGRKATTADLGLEAAGIRYDKRGIKVNAGLRTSNRRVYAIGDVAGGLQFTHVANYHAGIVIRRALFRLPAKVDTRIIPWVTFTDPELAHVGLSEAEAKQEGGLRSTSCAGPTTRTTAPRPSARPWARSRWLPPRTAGFSGATIVGAEAGELIQMWALAVSQKMKIKAMIGWISPYPTLSEINKRVAYRYYATAPSSPLVRWIIGFLAKFG